MDQLKYPSFHIPIKHSTLNPFTMRQFAKNLPRTHTQTASPGIPDSIGTKT